MHYITSGVPAFPVTRNSARGRPLLYLDYDGVLHPDDVYHKKGKGVYLKRPGHELFENVPILEAALEPYPELRIVLSTTWAKVLGFHRARKWLPATLQKRVIGATFHSFYTRRDEFQFMSRGQQVYADSQRRGAHAWAALDDDTEDWPSWCRANLVACDETLGLSCPVTQRSLQIQLETICG